MSLEFIKAASPPSSGGPTQIRLKARVPSVTLRLVHGLQETDVSDAVLRIVRGSLLPIEVEIESPQGGVFRLDDVSEARLTVRDGPAGTIQRTLTASAAQIDKPKGLIRFNLTAGTDLPVGRWTGAVAARLISDPTRWVHANTFRIIVDPAEADTA